MYKFCLKCFLCVENHKCGDDMELPDYIWEFELMESMYINESLMV
jgi:hypothetical protein